MPSRSWAVTWVRHRYPASSLPPSLSLSLSVGPSEVKVKGNPESLFEAETEREDAQKHWEKLKEKTPEKKKFEWRLREGVCVCGGVPSFQTQRWEETLLSPRRVSEKRKKKEKKGKRFPESRGAAAAAAVDGYHMLQVKVEKLLPDP